MLSQINKNHFLIFTYDIQDNIYIIKRGVNNEKNYWTEYWESYFNFMALYLSELRNRYPNADIKHEYTEVAKLFEPSMPPE